MKHLFKLGTNLAVSGAFNALFYMQRSGRLPRGSIKPTKKKIYKSDRMMCIMYKSIICASSRLIFMLSVDRKQTKGLVCVTLSLIYKEGRAEELAQKGSALVYLNLHKMLLKGW